MKRVKIQEGKTSPFSDLYSNEILELPARGQQSLEKLRLQSKVINEMDFSVTDCDTS